MEVADFSGSSFLTLWKTELAERLLGIKAEQMAEMRENDVSEGFAYILLLSYFCLLAGQIRGAVRQHPLQYLRVPPQHQAGYVQRRRDYHHPNS